MSAIYTCHYAASASLSASLYSYAAVLHWLYPAIARRILNAVANILAAGSEFSPYKIVPYSYVALVLFPPAYSNINLYINLPVH